MTTQAIKAQLDRLADQVGDVHAEGQAGGECTGPHGDFDFESPAPKQVDTGDDFELGAFDSE